MYNLFSIRLHLSLGVQNVESDLDSSGSTFHLRHTSRLVDHLQYNESAVCVHLYIEMSKLGE